MISYLKSLNRLGLVLCIIYLIIVGLFLSAGLASGEDPKGQFVLLQLPISVQLAILDELGLTLYFKNWSWPIAYAAFIPPACFGLYFIGIFVTRVWHHSKMLAVLLVLSPWFISMVRNLSHGLK
jgi:hypothetical protein